MEKLTGIYYRTYEEFGSGKKIFCIKQNETLSSANQNPYVQCEGYITHKEIGLPLEISGTYNKEANRFVMSDYRISLDNITDIKNFLLYKQIPTLGEKTASEIANLFPNDFLNEYSDDFMRLAGISDAVTEAVSMYVKRIKNIEETYRYITANGGNIGMVEQIFDKFGENSIATLKSNPYSMMYAGMTIEACESLAYSIGMKVYDERRIRALTHYILNRNESSGNTRITFHNFCHQIRKMEDKQKLYHTDIVFWAYELTKKDYFISQEEDDFYIYNTQTYINEELISKNIARLMNSASPNHPKQPISIEKLESICNIKYGESQKRAIKAIDTSGIKIITGGPGTGKTTTLNGILTKYEQENPDKRILLCAPTGCAAKRMQESTKRHAVTIHKALDIRPFLKDAYTAMTKTLDYDCIVVDECSMIDTEIFAILLSTIKAGTTLLLIGDKDQLASVGCGNVFSDLLESGKIEKYELDVNYRQGENNSIIRNAQKINNRITNLIKDSQTVIERYSSEAGMVNEIVRLYTSLFDKKNPDNVKIYTLTKKKYSTSSIKLNNLIKETVNPSANTRHFYANGYTFSEGDLIMMNRNNYDKGYYNGDQGYISNIIMSGYNKEVDVVIDGTVITLGNGDLSDLELAYAMTTHKAQGAECKNAIIVVPENPCVMLSKKIIYVAATRAKQTNYIISQNNALERAILSNRQVYRNTGLLTKMGKVRNAPDLDKLAG